MLVHVATIVAAHGIKGEVKIKSFTSDPKAFSTYGPLLDAKGRMFEITKAKFGKDEFICTLKNVTDRNAAEALRGTELFIAREKLPALKEGEIYLSDVVGKDAVAGEHKLDRIVGFQNYGAGELMELESGMLIPVSFIDSVADVVTLNLPDGYLEDEKQE